MRSIKKPIKILITVISLYISIGFIYSILSLYLYNIKNWYIAGGFSFPPLFLVGFVFDLFLWPLYIRADFINQVGIFALLFIKITF
jgi:hypothetical protein